ncbi:S-adenosyl-L-methionine-dependent methyltransferase [Butyriboletus roseoflavus]|nr:S-adenosyl-L-methionine-dependent methyltransferase [Butyriboletus roseoflavus]
MSTNKTKLESLLKLINSAAQEAITEYEKAGGDVPSIDSAELHPLDHTLDQVALKAAVRTLEGACAQLCTTLAPPSHTAINLVQVYDYACVRVALRENITDLLVDYPKGIHVNELSKIINIDAKKLARLLRVLATRGCYTEVETDTFANNRLSLILHSENPVRHMVSLHVEAVAKGAAVLHETLKDSKTAYSDHPDLCSCHVRQQQGRYHRHLLRLDETRGETLEESDIMGSRAVLAHFPFEKYSTLVDVGGGIGAFSLPLARIHKHIKITIHDLPEALVQARGAWARGCPEAVQENRVEFAELDFFTQVPVKGKDIYYLRNIIHDWPDHESALILRNLRQALGPHSRVLIHDYVLRELIRKHALAEAASLGTVVAPEPMLPNFGVGNIRMYQQDLTMLILHNAKERTLQNSLQLSITAGLKLEKVWDLAETCVLEFSAA